MRRAHENFKSNTRGARLKIKKVFSFLPKYDKKFSCRPTLKRFDTGTGAQESGHDTATEEAEVTFVRTTPGKRKLKQSGIARSFYTPIDSVALCGIRGFHHVLDKR